MSGKVSATYTHSFSILGREVKSRQIVAWQPFFVLVFSKLRPEPFVFVIQLRTQEVTAATLECLVPQTLTSWANSKFHLYVREMAEILYTTIDIRKWASFCSAKIYFCIFVYTLYCSST